MASKFSFDDARANIDTIGSGDGDGNIIDPATITGNDTGNGDGGDNGADEYIRDERGNILYTPTGRPRKRRKSRTNSKSGSAKNNSSDLGKNIDRLSAMLGFAHLAISNGLKVPEFQLDKVESDMLASSVVDVMSAFDVEISDKAMAISGLVSACGTIYGPRIISYNIRKKREKEEEKPIIFPSRESQFKGDTPIDPSAFNLGG